MKHPLLTVLIITMLFSSCDQLNATFVSEPENKNLVKSHYKNGKLKAEILIDKDRKRHGLSKQYYESGELKTEILYNHGVKEKAAQYYANGNKRMEFLYKDGQKHGKRNKYWTNGKLQSVLEYHEGDPKTGLIEYSEQGKIITNYPKLVVKHIDNLESTGKYTIQVYFSKYMSRGKYYSGKLNNGVFDNRPLPLKKSNNKGIIIYRPAPGTFVMEKINVIGRYKTPYGNPYLVQRQINVAIDY